MQTRFLMLLGLPLLVVGVGCSERNVLSEAPEGPPGVQAMSRLTRVEHENTLDELLGIASRASERLPEDPVAEGFDRVAEGLVMSPAHASHYERLTAEALDTFFGSDAPRSPDFERVVPCDPEVEGRSCVEQVARDFGALAWRRPLTDDDVAWVTDLYDATLRDATPTEALKLSMQGILLAPEFLFRIERSPAPGAVEPLDGYEVATRLAHFLWSSTPDRALLDDAASGALLADGGVASQAGRMLADPRADALLENLGGQWLGIRAVTRVQPNPEVHAFFDDVLKRTMQQEMLSIAEPFLRGDQPFDTVLTLQEAAVSRRLAQHYRWLHQPGEGGRMQYPEPDRLGLLTTAGWLSVTSHPDETSAVRRGHWILRQLLCDPPPPPPPDLEATVMVTPEGSVREQEEAVRQQPPCASCHEVMDPLGYALHRYDAVGLER
ncbi:MAG: DUF1592 domain-containing protein, partial [Myxococcota bacterium]